MTSYAPFGPPFGLIEGALKVLGTAFKPIPTEVCPSIRRGSVTWIGSGPEFFISVEKKKQIHSVWFCPSGRHGNCRENLTAPYEIRCLEQY